MPDGMDWPKRGRKPGQRNPNSVAKDAAIERAKSLVEGGIDASEAATIVEPDYFRHAATSADGHKRRLKYLAQLLK
jgi:predicted SnoaL-like aldol condensation-catalyzing enzyme